MKRQKIQFNKIKLLGTLGISCLGYLAFISPHESVEAMKSVATHIGTFEGSTTFTTSSRNGINPGLFIEVMDDEGNLTQYESEEGIITIPNTKEGAYVTQAKLLGKTKYVDEDTGEVLDQFEEGRNLRLESAQMPVLTTTGKNLYSGYEVGSLDVSTGVVDTTVTNACTTNFINIKGREKLKTKLPGRCIVLFYDANKEFVDTGWHEYSNANPTISIPNGYDLHYMRIRIRPGAESEAFKKMTDVMVVDVNDDINSYEPYKSNILSCNEEVELRGIGDVKDELDLLTGEVAQRVGKTTITGDLIPNVGAISWNNNSETMCFENFSNIIPFEWNQIISADWPISNDGYNSSLTHEYFNPLGGYGVFRIKRSRLETEDAKGFKKWLNENPITIYHPVIGSESIKTVDLTSTYFFKPINKDFIEVTGTVIPLVGSVTVPTAPILFTLDPNQEVGQQFIAPEFSVVNETNAPIRLILNRFEQTTQMLNDVLPTTYENWEGLNKQESKDIALALVPKVGDGWLSLNEEPRYVAGALSNELGTIKAKSSVDFTFSALHGQAFEETLNPSYRLGFVFEFMS